MGQRGEALGNWGRVLSSQDRKKVHKEYSLHREGEILYDTPYMWNLKRNDTNELTKQKQTHRLAERIYGYQEGRDS